MGDTEDTSAFDTSKPAFSVKEAPTEAAKKSSRGGRDSTPQPLPKDSFPPKPKPQTSPPGKIDEHLEKISDIYNNFVTKLGPSKQQKFIKPFANPIFGKAARFVLILCCATYPLAKLSSLIWKPAAQPKFDPATATWRAEEGKYCSTSKGSVALNSKNDYGFGISEAQCKANCIDFGAGEERSCNMYTYGKWVKPGIHLGKMRCQLYEKCAEADQQDTMTIHFKPAPPSPGASLSLFGIQDLLAVVQLGVVIMSFLDKKFELLAALVSCGLCLSWILILTPMGRASFSKAILFFGSGASLAVSVLHNTELKAETKKSG